jgi:predicted N-acetyltransferase YhbS
MIALIAIPMFAAAGYSLIYLLGGGYYYSRRRWQHPPSFKVQASMNQKREIQMALETYVFGVCSEIISA